MTVDGQPLTEKYVTHNAPLDLPPNSYGCGPRRFAAVVVPADSVFVMGDNRSNSVDSRCAGPIPTASVFAVLTN